MAINRLAGGRARAYLFDCLSYLGIAALEIPLGIAVFNTPLAENPTYLAVASSAPPVLATVLAARAECGPTQATWGKRRRGLQVTADQPLTFRRALLRNALKIGLPWTLGHLVAYGAVDGGFERSDPITLWAMVAVYAWAGGNLALALFGSGRTLHDRGAGTAVHVAGHSRRCTAGASTNPSPSPSAREMTGR